MSHDINSQQNFEAFPLKPNGQSKTWVRTTESHPIQQSPGVNRPVEFAGGAFRNSSLQPNQREHTSRSNDDIVVSFAVTQQQEMYNTEENVAE